MITIYLKQSYNLLKENRFVNGISVAGTALSVAAVMLVYLVYQVNFSAYAPESNRYRILFVNSLQACGSDGNPINNGGMSHKVVRECLYPLQTPEAVTAFTDRQLPVNIRGQQFYDKYTIKFTDDGFWKVFDFTFLSGVPFTHADWESGIRQAVISDKLARKLFGTVEATGQTLRMNYADYQICGVVKEVSQAAENAYGGVWVPYTVNSSLLKENVNYCEGTTGEFTSCILARSSSDFEPIRREMLKLQAAFNASLTNTKLDYMYSPYTQWQAVLGTNGFDRGTVGEWFKTTGATVLFLLLLPALNIIGITLTQFRKRRSEIGVRKAFGARSFSLVEQVMTENLLISCIGGLIGLVLSYALLSLCKSFFFSGTIALTHDMLIQPFTFVAAFFFTLLLNLLSAAIPAWRASRMPITEALHDME